MVAEGVNVADPEDLLIKVAGDASPDLLRTLLQTVINMLLPADADGVVGTQTTVTGKRELPFHNK